MSNLPAVGTSIKGVKVISLLEAEKVAVLANGKFGTFDHHGEWVMKATLDAARKCQVKDQLPRELTCFRIDRDGVTYTVIGRRGGKLLLKKDPSSWAGSKTEAVWDGGGYGYYLVNPSVQDAIGRLYEEFAKEVEPLKAKIEKLTKDRDKAIERLKEKLVRVTTENVAELLDKQQRGEL